MIVAMGLSGKRYELVEPPFKEGAQGQIYNLQNYKGYIAKIYTGNITKKLEQKIMFMNGEKLGMDILYQVAWPLDVLYDINQHFCGFVMRKLDMTGDLQELYEYPPVQNISVSKKITVARNICVILSEIHKTRYIFGDFNPLNIGINIDTNKIFFLDIDSYHIVLDKKNNSAFRCEVCLDGYVAPELLMKIAREGLTQNAYELASLDTFTQDTDKFALAIHIFKLLMNGFTPFNGIKEVIGVGSQNSPGLGSEAVMKDSYCFKPGKKPLAVAVPPLAALPPAVGDLFTRAFIQGRKNPQARPSASEWDTALAQYESSLKMCSTNANHQYYHALNSCPWCEADARFQAVTR